jgi:hypothetical protein
MNNMSILGKTGTIEGAFTNNKGIESRFAKYKPVF